MAVQYFEQYRDWSIRKEDICVDFPRKNIKGFLAESIGIKQIDFNKLEVRKNSKVRCGDLKKEGKLYQNMG